MTSDRRDRAHGALYGLAVGDALGMPTQSTSRAAVVARFGEVIDGFAPAPPDQPLAAGLPAGHVTDDTEQALLLARLLVDGHGTLDVRRWADALLAWEHDMRARGSLDLLGPSTRRALADLVAGVDPARTGRFGDTNGAAMRVAPVGIVRRCGDLDALVDHVVDVSAVTHNTGLALAGAAAVAAAVSAALDGADLDAVTAVAVDAARRAGRRGHWVAGADVGDRIAWAVGLVKGRPLPEAISLVDSLVGTSLRAQESVPAAFAVVHACPDDPWLACRVAASVGGDCDTVAAMAGAVAGALHGAARLPPDAVATVERVNRLGAAELADELLALRDG